jgi:hypothetical protein
MQAIGLSVFIAPFIGSTLVDLGLGLPAVLLIGAGIRLVAAVFAASSAQKQAEQVPSV